MIINLIKIITALFLTLLIAAVVFINVFDANKYKPEIIEQVEKATGRDFNIEGDIDLTLYPWIGASIEKVTLGNAKGFSANNFAALERVNLKINVLPLLSGNVGVSKIQLNGLKLSLEVDKNSKTNWQDLSSGEKADDAKKQAKTDDADKSSPLESLHVEGIELLGAEISYIDKANDTQSRISELNLEASSIEFDRPADISFHARVEHNQPVLDASIDLSTALTFNKQFSIFDIRDLLLKLAVKQNEFIKQDLALSLESQANLDLDKQTAEVKSVKINAFNVTTNANLSIMQLLKTPAISGTVTVEAFNAVALSEKLGITLPVMSAKKALSSVALSTNLKMIDQRLDLDAINIKLDDSNLSGWVHILDIAATQLSYELTLNKINLNDYMPPTPAETKTATSEDIPQDIIIELPIELLKKLDVEGQFSLAAMHVLDYDVTDLSLTTTAKNGIINVAPIKLNVLDGTINAKLGLDVTKTLPAYRINIDATDLKAGPVVNPFLAGIQTDKPMHLRGAANLTADLKTQGNSLNAMKKAAKGTVTLDMYKTEIEGFDPEYLIRTSVADYISAKGLGSAASIRSEYTPREVTAFDTIHDTATISDGKITTSDFLMDSKRMSIKAKGFADIISNSLDMTSSLQLKRDKTTAEKIFDDPISVRAYGPFAQLKFKLDTSSITGAVGTQLKDKAAEIKDKAKAETDQKIEAEKQRAKDKLKEKFKSLF